jgi:hypothetical protein
MMTVMTAMDAPLMRVKPTFAQTPTFYQTAVEMVYASWANGTIVVIVVPFMYNPQPFVKNALHWMVL